MILKDVAYLIYENQLKRDVVRADVFPHHIGLILDGNRRFARKKGLKNTASGHQKGADKLDDVLNWCEELNIPIVTIWVLSTDNFKREEEELKGLLKVIENKISELGSSPKIHRKKMRIKVLGKTDILPRSIREAIAKAEKATAHYKDFLLNIAIAYGGRQEITDAFKKLLDDKKQNGEHLEDIIADINPDEVGKYLYTFDVPDPDLIIRTSGETRLSGFLLWQSAYSEFYFCDVFWPSFRHIDFLRAIRSYQQRRRRFGN